MSKVLNNMHLQLYLPKSRIWAFFHLIKEKNGNGNRNRDDGYEEE